MRVCRVAAMNRASRLGLVLAAAAALAGCGGGGGSSTGGGDTSTTGSETMFKASDVAFTFEYPKGFQQVDEDNDKVLARVVPDPSDIDNGLKIRQTSSQELPLSA